MQRGVICPSEDWRKFLYGRYGPAKLVTSRPGWRRIWTSEWQRLDDRRACRIRHVLTLGGLTDRDRWPEIQEAMMDAMVRLEKALKPQIKRLRA
jgi:hypothetical protein